MTADSPRDYSPEAEGVRDCCANLAMTFRDFTVAFDGSQLLTPIPIHPTHFRDWASRLERVVQRMDLEAGRTLEDEKASQRP